tara:strand:+ start:999 stop:1826 length:828 start_codon:yes stop_codon:yes gene_type:complete
MKNLSMFCITLNTKHFEKINKLEYLPVGLGEKKFSSEWFTDKTNENISYKNPFYGEYTFHYWLWKNYLDKLEDKWIGFCQYRKFWTTLPGFDYIKNFDQLNNLVLKEIPKNYENCESIIGELSFVNQFRFTKFLKRNLKHMILNPALFIDSKKRNLKFHFDMWHGHGNLDKAIRLLDKKDRNDFNDFMNENVAFNPHNMFICKSKKILIKYYDDLFPWLERCEKEFGFKKFETYGLKRIYGFLAERYMSYWFKKNTKYKIMPILFKDISDFEKDL